MNFPNSLSFSFILFLLLTTQSLQQEEINTLINKNIEQSQPNQTQKQKTPVLAFQKGLIVKGKTTASSINTPDFNIGTKSAIKGDLNSKIMTVDTINVDKVSTSNIYSNTGVITIIGNVIINQEPGEDEQEQVQREQTEFQKQIKKKIDLSGDSLSVKGVKQWSMVEHDDFETEESVKGWKNARTSSCSKNGNVFIGGHCNLSYNEISKKFYISIEHKQVKVTASYHMLDNWEGEFGYMKINGKIVWIKEGVSDPKNGMNYCGGTDNDAAFNLPIDVNVNHEGKELEITFGSTLEKDPCEASFGVDDVMIYVK